MWSSEQSLIWISLNYSTRNYIPDTFRMRAWNRLKMKSADINFPDYIIREVEPCKNKPLYVHCSLSVFANFSRSFSTTPIDAASCLLIFLFFFHLQLSTTTTLLPHIPLLVHVAVSSFIFLAPTYFQIPTLDSAHFTSSAQNLPFHSF